MSCCQGDNVNADNSAVSQVLNPDFRVTQNPYTTNASPYMGQFTIPQVLSPDFTPPLSGTSYATMARNKQTMSDYRKGMKAMNAANIAGIPSNQMNNDQMNPNQMATAKAGPYVSDNQVTPITPSNEPPALTLASTQYLNGALRTQIGSMVEVQFLIGTNTYQDRTGILLGVGADYILLNEFNSDDILFCDFYTIKFVRVYK